MDKNQEYPAPLNCLEFRNVRIKWVEGNKLQLQQNARPSTDDEFGWNLLLSETLPEKVALENAMICLDGSVRLGTYFPVGTTLAGTET